MKPYYQEKNITIYHGDCLKIMPQLEPGSFDAVITDPPYNVGIDEWDHFEEIEPFTLLVKRLLSKGFYAHFGMMPSIFEWYQAASGAGLIFKEHIAWIKRMVLQSKRLARGHESIFIYSNGSSNYFICEGPFEDVKVPGLAFDTISLEGIKRHISYLIKYPDGIMRQDFRNRMKAHERFSRSSNKAKKDRNYTNVWSFLPESQKRRNGNRDHATKKPLAIFHRLIEMLTPKNGSFCDPFLGSGTSLVAAKQLGRQAVGMDNIEKHCEVAAKRVMEVLI